MALFRVTVASFDFIHEGFKVGVDDIGGQELLVMVLEGEFVFPFWHLNSDGCLADSSALWFVGLKQILSGVAN